MRSFWRRLTVVEISIVAVIVGLAIGAIVKVAQSVQENRHAAVSTAATEAMQAQLLTALDIFAKANRRFPCPADAASAGGEAVVCSGEGLVPYRSLALTEAFGRDGFGTPLLYRLGPDCTATVVSLGRDGKLGRGSTDDLTVTRSAADLGLPQGACPRP